jgi:hypothetical protein
MVDVFFDAILSFFVFIIFFMLFLYASATYYIFLKLEDGVVSKKSVLIF